MFVTRVIVYLVIVLLVARALRQLLGGFAQGMRGDHPPSGRIDAGVRMVRDPICGTFVIPTGARAVRDAAGVHHFCSDKCRDAFVARARRTS
jgi:YHS domain-containing protein